MALKQLYIVRPLDLVALVQARTGLALKSGTLKIWRKAVPLVLPTSREAADRWILDVLSARNERRAKAREQRIERARQGQAG